MWTGVKDDSEKRFSTSPDPPGARGGREPEDDPENLFGERERLGDEGWIPKVVRFRDVGI